MLANGIISLSAVAEEYGIYPSNPTKVSSPGLHVAEQSMFITTARFIWGFHLERARDKNGNFIPIDFTTKGMVPGSFSSPKPFPCGNIPLRSH
jgi:hypothetical protein